MKKNALLLCAVLSLALLLTACGGESGTKAPEVPEATVTGGEEVEALKDTTLAPGTVLESKECAVMVSYLLASDDEEAAMATVEGWAAANGYEPIGAQGEGSKIYAASVWPDGGGVTAVVLGEEDTFRLGVLAGEEGQTRRFAQKNILWTAEDVKAWQVDNVEEQDYYEEDGKQYPCYLMYLTPAE